MPFEETFDWFKGSTRLSRRGTQTSASRGQCPQDHVISLQLYFTSVHLKDYHISFTGDEEHFGNLILSSPLDNPRVSKNKLAYLLLLQYQRLLF